jgi:hypothetical protein
MIRDNTEDIRSNDLDIFQLKMNKTIEKLQRDQNKGDIQGLQSDTRHVESESTENKNQL